ncbi:hypothetical protein AVEN_251740-1 [Araneus ventricosus]|uniref:Reverse transcriptase domain-containing protein n=1 Tax=Araneus ventricosus TaxID=182803 RepID=A0A4Y2T437_ARAVE|nr:hypothetical protein AVEN_251740-1 [Araneus ventricosus]
MAEHVLKRLFDPPEDSNIYTAIPSTQFIDPLFNNQEVWMVISHLPTGKAPGYDGIDNLILKILHKKFNILLTSIFNKCMELRHFPSSLKIDNTILFQKTGKDPQQISSHRLISLLTTIRKASHTKAHLPYEV